MYRSISKVQEFEEVPSNETSQSPSENETPSTKFPTYFQAQDGKESAESDMFSFEKDGNTADEHYSRKEETKLFHLGQFLATGI